MCYNTFKRYAHIYRYNNTYIDIKRTNILTDAGDVIPGRGKIVDGEGSYKKLR